MTVELALVVAFALLFIASIRLNGNQREIVALKERVDAQEAEMRTLKAQLSDQFKSPYTITGAWHVGVACSTGAAHPSGFVSPHAGGKS